MVQVTSILKKRIQKVRRLFSAQKADCMLIALPANISYLTGFLGEDSWLLITAHTNILITDSRFILQAEKQCPNSKIYVRKGRMTQAFTEILKKYPEIKTAVLEDTVEIGTYNILKKKLPVKVKTVSKVVEAAREIKDQAEISEITKAAHISKLALDKILKKIRIGMTEIQIAAMLDYEMKKFGCNPAFETIVAFGTNSAMPHYRPANRKLKKIDTILFDFGAKLNNYCSDLTRCFAVGKVTDFYAKVYKTVLEAQTAAINILKAGLEAKDADDAAKQIITSQNLKPYGHGLGHGLGIDVHELPTVSYMSKLKLQAGNVITVEPGVYIPNKFGIRIEDDVLITDSGCEILSALLKTDDTPILKLK
ncbi:MAG: putative peptidase [Planctomycetes bacterium ADurb.Bin401]|nr:MAG: putative peptidase [Planctomycetes bacterium ADurb.Bin401]